MKGKYIFLILTSLFFLLIVLFYYQFLIVLFPNQSPEFITNENYWILIEILTDPTIYNTENLFNIPSFIWTLINGLILGAYMMSIGLVFSMKKRNFFYAFAMLMVIYLIIGSFGFRFTFNFPIFLYKSIQTNTAEAQLFFTINILLLCSIFVLTHLIEGDKK